MGRLEISCSEPCSRSPKFKRKAEHFVIIRYNNLFTTPYCKLGASMLHAHDNEQFDYALKLLLPMGTNFGLSYQGSFQSAPYHFL